jgi:multiple sugar transport system permease protein
VRARGARAEHRLGWALCAPAVLALAAVAGYPLLHAVWLSTQRYDLRFPGEQRFVGLANYASVLASDVWWQALANTLLVTAASVSLELLCGLAVALAMHRAPWARGPLRAFVLVPYAMVTVVAALSWRFAFDPATGFVNDLLGSDRAWLAQRGTAFVVIVLSEVWKTTPFLSLLLLAGLTQVPDELLQAARVDGAGRTQRFFRVTLPLLRPAILVALLFRTVDAFRIFDTIFVQTRGAQDTESVSIVGYHTLVTRLNLGLGSAVSVLIFACAAGIVVLFAKGLGAAPAGPLGGRE